MAESKVIKSVVVKDARAAGNRMLCYPSVTGILDLYLDVIFPNSFTKCLPPFLRRGFNPHDHQWTWDALVGYPVSAYESGNKLVSEMEFHSDQKSQDALTKCRERIAAGLEVGLSIGFTMMSSGYVGFDNGKQLLSYAKRNNYDLKLFDVAGISACTDPCCAIIEIEDLWEYSLTPVPANQQAMAVAIKSMPGISLAVGDRAPRAQGGKSKMSTAILRTICGARDLSIADKDTKWSAKDAASRIKEKVGALDEPNIEFAKAFVVCDGPVDEFDSYKLPFADVVDGEIKASPKAIYALAAVLQGARAGVELSDQDHESAKRFCESYYAKMAAEFGDDTIKVPWAAADTVWKGLYLGQFVERNICLSAMCESFNELYYTAADALAGYGDFKDMDDDSVYAACSGMHDEFKDLNMAIIRAIKAGGGAESPEQAADTAKRMLVSLISSQDLGDGLSYAKQGQFAVDATMLLIERTKDRAAMRRKANRELSGTDRQRLKDHAARLEEAAGLIKRLLADTDPKANDEEIRELELQFLELQVAPALSMAA